MSISGNGNFLVSAAHDKSIRIWEKTDEIVVLEDEKETVGFELFTVFWNMRYLLYTY